MFKTFEGWKTTEPSEFKDPGNEGIYHYIFGIPSGEVIDTTEDEIIKLISAKVIKFDYKYKCFSFLDLNYKKIKKLLISPEKIEEIYTFLNSCDVKKENIEINEDMSVNVYGDVNMYSMNLVKIPIKFVTVDGNFNCNINKLNSLINSPDIITGDFNCSHNKIKSLLGGPTHVAGGYECCFNELQNLVGFPETCKIKFDCAFNQIMSLRGCPEKVETKYFDVSNNKLRSLVNGPKSVFNFDCSHNEITTLANGIREAKGIFDCTNNNLYNLMGMPICEKIIFLKGNNIDEEEPD